MDTKYYTYRHIRLDTNLPFYIGKGSNNRAWSKDGRNPYWHNIVNKVGYKVDLMFTNISEKEAFDKEKYFIKLYGQKGTGILVNMTNGGEGISGHKHSEEVRKKISESHKGKKCYMFGKSPSNETKKRMSLSHMGRKVSRETRIKIGKANSNKIPTQAVRVKMSQSHNKKVVNCRNEIFESGLIAAKAFGIKNSGNITQNLKGRRNSAGKYSDGTKIKWSYHRR